MYWQLRSPIGPFLILDPADLKSLLSLSYRILQKPRSDTEKSNGSDGSAAWCINSINIYYKLGLAITVFAQFQFHSFSKTKTNFPWHFGRSTRTDMFVPMRCSVCAFKFKILQNSPVLTNVFKTHMYVFLTLYRVWYWVGLYLRRCITFLPLLPGSQLRPFLQFLYRGTIYKYEYLHPWQ